MTIKLSTFDGIMPIIDRRLLPDTAAQVAHNVNLEHGTLRPYKNPAPIFEMPDANQKSIFLYRGNWLYWPTAVHVVESGLSDDPYERIYFTGDGIPKVRGVLNGTEVTYPLGVPRPNSKIVAAISPKTATTWTRAWKSFYEEPDGTQRDNRDHQEGVDVIVTTPAKVFTMFTIPAKVTASANAKFVLYFEAYKTNGVLFGIVYPNISAYAGNSDLFVDGSSVDGIQNISGTTLTFTLGYNVTGLKTNSTKVKIKRKKTKVTTVTPIENPTLTALYYTQDKRYLYTFVTAFGEEGPPSEPSESYAMDPSQQATLTGFQTSVTGGYNITHIRIYRTVTGDGGTEFAFVAQIPFGTASYIDIIPDEDTAETIPTTTWDAPPANMAGLKAMPGQFMIGYFGNTLCFSEVGQPHAWPVAYQLTMRSDIVALGVSGSTIVVATKGLPEIVNATDPTNVSQAVIPSPQPCMSERGLIEYGGVVFYPSADGLIKVDGLSAVVVTASYFSKTQWLALQPETMIAAVYDDRIFMFSESETLIFMFLSDQLRIVTNSVRAAGTHVDVELDALFMIQDNQVTQWEGSDEPQIMRWKSREYVYPRPIDHGVARITARGYPVQLRLNADNVQVLSVQVATDRARRLPKTRPEKFWSYEIEGSTEITEILCGQSMGDLSTTAP